MNDLTQRHPTLWFYARRSARLVISLFVMVIISFGMIQVIPGNPVRAQLGITAPPREVAIRTRQLGLDKPLLSQLWTYLQHLFTGHLGTSISLQEPVSNIIATRLPNTLAIAGLAFVVTMFLSVTIGLLLGAFTRDGRHPRTELSFTATTGLLITLPEFLLAVVLQYVFGVKLGWLPVAEKSGWTSYIMPIASLAVPPSAALARIVRVEMLSALSRDYIRTARSKRLPARILYIRHVLPNVLTATLTLGGLLLAGLVAGTVLVETVFAWPGLGTTIVYSIEQKDYPLIQAVVLLLGSLVLFINFIVDILLGAIDPRSAIKTT
ncbi:MAG: ABC transporter permease [Acidimicrobiales bacterium]